MTNSARQIPIAPATARDHGHGHGHVPSPLQSLHAKVRSGLSRSPRSLPPALLYDDLGSALFEAITHLPEYGVTRADRRLLTAHAADTLRALAPTNDVVELGPGSGEKAKIVLRAALSFRRDVHFTAVDVSAAALEACRRTLEDLPLAEVDLACGTYLEGLERAPRRGGARLVLFLGSNLSNFERDEARAFLAAVRRELLPGDALLLATDLDKSPDQLLPAYDDALGVTAAFDRNVLVRLNRDFGANFDLAAFKHEARYAAAERRVEMHLRALRDCRVRVDALELEIEIARGETIHTESSHRFRAEELRAWGDETGFSCVAQWFDAAWPFAHTLLVAQRARRQS